MEQYILQSFFGQTQAQNCFTALRRLRQKRYIMFVVPNLLAQPWPSRSFKLWSIFFAIKNPRKTQFLAKIVSLSYGVPGVRYVKVCIIVLAPIVKGDMLFISKSKPTLAQFTRIVFGNGSTHIPKSQISSINKTIGLAKTPMNGSIKGEIIHLGIRIRAQLLAF